MFTCKGFTGGLDPHQFPKAPAKAPDATGVGAGVGPLSPPPPDSFEDAPVDGAGDEM